MTTSFFDLYKIGVGPSSSHTMGPMRAAFQFARSLAGNIESVHRVQADLYGSLALTGPYIIYPELRGGKNLP